MKQMIFTLLLLVSNITTAQHLSISDIEILLLRPEFVPMFLKNEGYIRNPNFESPSSDDCNCWYKGYFYEFDNGNQLEKSAVQLIISDGKVYPESTILYSTTIDNYEYLIPRIILNREYVKVKTYFKNGMEIYVYKKVISSEYSILVEFSSKPSVFNFHLIK